MKNGDVRAEMRPHPHEFIPCLSDLTEPGKENERIAAAFPPSYQASPVPRDHADEGQAGEENQG